MKRYLFPVLAMCLISCFEQGDCSDVSSNVMSVNFYDNANNQKLTISLDSIKMVGWDTVMYEAKSVNTVTLPVNPATTTMTYVFYYNSTQATLDLEYELKTFALAPDCNAIDLIKIEDTNAVTIQKVTIKQSKLTSTPVENIQLYF